MRRLSSFRLWESRNLGFRKLLGLGFGFGVFIWKFLIWGSFVYMQYLYIENINVSIGFSVSVSYFTDLTRCWVQGVI